MHAVEAFFFFHVFLCSSMEIDKVIISFHLIEFGMFRASMNFSVYLSVPGGITYVSSKTALALFLLLAHYPHSGSKGAVLKAVTSFLHWRQQFDSAADSTISFCVSMIVVTPVSMHVTVALKTGTLVLRLWISLDILPSSFCLSSFCDIFFITSRETLQSLVCLEIYSLIKSFLNLRKQKISLL